MHNGSKVHPPQITHIPAPTNQQQNQQKFNWGSILKPAAGGLFGIASSIFNHFMSERSAEKQYQRQLDFWQKQNEYNSPAAQRDRLEAAGFNPAAALGDIAGNNAAGQLSSVPGNDYDKRGFLDVNALNNSLQLFTQMESIGANTDMMKRQIELSYIEELIKNSTKYGIDLTNKEKEELLKWLPQEKEANLKTALEQITKIIAERDHIKASTTGLGIDNKNKQQQYDDAHRAADDDHNLKLSAETRANELHVLNKQVLSNQISLEQYKKRIADNEAYKSDTDRFIRTLTGVDMDKLNPVLVPLVYQFGEAERSGVLSDEDFSLYVDTIQTYLSAERLQLIKKDPDYISAIEGKRLSLEQRKQLFAEIVAQFNAELDSKGLEIKAIEAIDKLLNIFK